MSQEFQIIRFRLIDGEYIKATTSAFNVSIEVRQLVAYLHEVIRISCVGNSISL